jgi:hypothetical protein
LVAQRTPKEPANAVDGISGQANAGLSVESLSVSFVDNGWVVAHRGSWPRMSKPTVTMSRRQVMHGMISTIAIAQLLRLAVGTKAVAAPIAPITDKWAQSIGELARDLNSRSLTVTQWQDAIEALHKTVPIADVLKVVDFDRMRPKLERSGRFESYQYVSLPDIGPTIGLFWTNLFIVPEGGAIPPHGHNELVTAHLIVHGRLRTRTFDRVVDEPGRMLLRPTRDEHCDVGSTITMSDERDNVHWFVAEGGPAFTLDVGAIAPTFSDHLNGTGRDGRIYLDPTAGRRADGLIEAVVIDQSTSRARFGGGAD